MTATFVVPRAQLGTSASRRPTLPTTVDDAVEEHAVSFASTGDTALGGAWFTPAGREPTAAVVVVGGAGVPAHAYRHLARHLASHGAAVLAFDYRGVAASRVGELRGLHAGTEEWSADVGAALVMAHRRFPDVPLHAVAHSVGTFLLGASPAAVLLTRAVLLAPHTAYYGDYHPRWRPAMWLAWHVLMPLVTNLVGYFPGRALRLGEDLPRGIALDWARRRHPDVLHSPATRERFELVVRRFERMQAATLALTVTDDAFATEAGARRLLAYYASAPAEHETVSPAALGVPNVGHFGFLRAHAGRYFWERAARWLELDAAHAVAPLRRIS